MIVLDFLKRHRVKIIKVLIIISVAIFLFFALLHLLTTFPQNIYNSISLIYLVMLVLCNLITEFSPYILHNILLPNLPFLENYSGRACIYLLVGALAITPEMPKTLNFSGYFLIALSILCFWLNWVLTKNNNEYQDFVAMKDNYQEDYNDDSNRESLKFPVLKTNYNAIESGENNEGIKNIEEDIVISQNLTNFVNSLHNNEENCQPINQDNTQREDSFSKELNTSSKKIELQNYN